MLLISFYSQKTKEWSEVKISFTDWSRHIYLPSIGWEWDRPDAFPYLGQVPLPRWAQEFCNHRNMVGRAIKSPVLGVTLTLFQAGSSFVLEASLSLEHHTNLQWRLPGRSVPKIILYMFCIPSMIYHSSSLSVHQLPIQPTIWVTKINQDMIPALKLLP